MLEYFEHYTDNKDDPSRPVYSVEEAYAKCVRRWPDAIFDGYSFPKVYFIGYIIKVQQP